MPSNNDQIVVNSVNLGLEWALDLARLAEDIDVLIQAIELLLAERKLKYANDK